MKHVDHGEALGHACKMLDHELPDVPEIAAGTMQLQPVDDASLCGAIAALGSSARNSQGTWVAKDIVTAKARAYVALVPGEPTARVVAAPGIVGSEHDAEVAAEVIRRYASQALGLIAS